MLILNDIAICGIKAVDARIPYLISQIVSFIQIGVPILLIILGMLDLGKAVMAQKEDEIKKGQQTFFKRLIAAAIVFFVVVIVKLMVGLVSDNSSTITGCIDSILSCKGAQDCKK